MLTAATVATMLGLSQRAVYDLAARDAIPSYRDHPQVPPFFGAALATFAALGAGLAGSGAFSHAAATGVDAGAGNAGT